MRFAFAAYSKVRRGHGDRLSSRRGQLLTFQPLILATGDSSNDKRLKDGVLHSSLQLQTKLMKQKYPFLRVAQRWTSETDIGNYEFPAQVARDLNYSINRLFSERSAGESGFVPGETIEWWISETKCFGLSHVLSPTRLYRIGSGLIRDFGGLGPGCIKRWGIRILLVTSFYVSTCARTPLEHVGRVPTT